MKDPTLPPLEYHHPATFRSRGVAAPFTTPLLSGARVRESARSGTELVVPNPSGGRGVYVLHWPGVRALCVPTVFDTMMFRRFSRLSCIDPGSVRTAVLEVSAQGFAGQDAAEAASTALAADHQHRLRAHFHLLVRLMEEAEPGSSESARFGDTSTEFDVRASAFLNRIAREFGQSGAILSAALARMGATYAAMGVGEDPDARLPRLLTALCTMQSELDQWLGAESGNDIGGVGRSVASALATTIRLGDASLRTAGEAQIDLHALVQRWLSNPEAVRSEATRPLWLLDGWDQLVRLWGSSDTGLDRLATLLEMAPMVPLLPEEAKNWTDRPVPPEALDETCRVVSHDDSWRRGAAALALVARNEKLLGVRT